MHLDISVYRCRQSDFHFRAVKDYFTPHRHYAAARAARRLIPGGRNKERLPLD
jgi:hypothetical protein